jgi:hypothetical protein
MRYRRVGVSEYGSMGVAVSSLRDDWNFVSFVAFCSNPQEMEEAPRIGCLWAAM